LKGFHLGGSLGLGNELEGGFAGVFAGILESILRTLDPGEELCDFSFVGEGNKLGLWGEGSPEDSFTSSACGAA